MHILYCPLRFSITKYVYIHSFICLHREHMGNLSFYLYHTTCIVILLWYYAQGLLVETLYTSTFLSTSSYVLTQKRVGTQSMHLLYVLMHAHMNVGINCVRGSTNEFTSQTTALIAGHFSNRQTAPSHADRTAFLFNHFPTSRRSNTYVSP